MKKTQLYGLIIMTFCFLAGFLVLQAMTSFVPKEIIAAFNGNYEHAKRFVHLTGIRSMYLLYDTNTDTKSEARMHKEIDNEGPTVVIFQDNKNVFGGVTFVSWVSSNSFDGWIEDSKAYLFTLYPSMKIFPIKKGQEQFAFYGQEDYSTCFGYFLSFFLSFSLSHSLIIYQSFFDYD